MSYLRMLKICMLSILTAVAASFAARAFTLLINGITNAVYYLKFSFAESSPAQTSLGPWLIFIPIAGSVLVGLLIRFGSKMVRGHGIPEAMEQVLVHQSRVSLKVAVLKPLSAAVSIGTGGPFGAEGPIIATGGSIGAYIGQVFEITASERKILLAAGAAAGMTMAFESPVAAVLLAVELLLFEYRSSSIIPVALAAVVAKSINIAMIGRGPFAECPPLERPTEMALLIYVLMGFAFGLFSVFFTKALHAMEILFEKIPAHWFFKLLLGALFVGSIGYINPRILGAGYENIDHILQGNLPLTALLSLCALKLIAWIISLSSGTSGGTLAPIFTFGGAVGSILAILLNHIFPGLNLDPRFSGLIGMAAVFTGASHAFLASVVLVFEITRQPFGLLPILGSCATAYFVSSLLMKNSLMTAPMARKGIRVPVGYAIDYLDQFHVRDLCSKHLVSLKGSSTLQEARSWIASNSPGTDHQGYPVLDAHGSLIGVLTLRDIHKNTASLETTLAELIHRPPIFIYDDSSCSEASEIMAKELIGRIPVISGKDRKTVIGMITRSDLIAAQRKRLADE